MGKTILILMTYYIIRKKYYQNLYSESLEIDEKPLTEITGENPNKLTNDESINLEGEITYTELATTLRNMKNGKSPGNDGFTTEFFKFKNSRLFQFLTIVVNMD